MKRLKKSLAILGIAILCAPSAFANDVAITQAKLDRASNGSYSFSVTLLHDDSGWKHYADKWQVLDSAGNIIGERVLLHPHEDEQPFTRSASGIVIPEGETTLFIRAHDLVHGWNEQTLKIDLSQLSERGKLTVRAEE